MAAKVLCIEDHSDNRKLIVYLLEKSGHQVRTAESGEEGIEIAAREEFDLVICDIHLPGVDGCEVAKRLKANPARRHTPLIAVTALAMVGDRDELLRSGFDGYLAKPISPRHFVQQIESFLRSAAPELPKAAHVADVAIEQ